ncbi:MAG: type I glyceraldehyde-3-phosphate dehydrogenase [Bacteriovoracaceae bacterium]|nr:type I glyceraldehyde-3-phosphate dehydrogenase [Bacteriovoracaceae bacterium]
MKKIRVGINGVGRIGRTILREFFVRKNEGEKFSFEIVAVNNPGEPDIYAHLLKYDSVHGTFPLDVSYANGELKMGKNTLQFYTEKEPKLIPWNKGELDLIIDATGRFKGKPDLSAHLNGTVTKVLMCAPGKDMDGTFVMGVNHQNYDHKKHHVVSNASCTTNCLAPIAKLLSDEYGIESGYMTTIHSYTSDQNLLDNSHNDLRRARAAAVSMIPTTTGAAKALGDVIPELKGKLDGISIRVPTPNVSVVDLSVNLQKKSSIEAVNQLIKKASEGKLAKLLAYCDEPLVSQDFRGRRESSIFDSLLTNLIGNNLKVVSWYDNEAGYSNRIIDFANYMGEQF